MVTLTPAMAFAQATGTPSYSAPVRAFQSMELGALMSFPQPGGTAYEGVYRAANGRVDVGIRGGVFQVPDVKLTAAAILSMCTGVASWFSEGGRLAPEAIAGRYVEVILKSLGARSDDRRGKGPRF